MRELLAIQKKAEEKGDRESLDFVNELIKAKNCKTNYFPKISVREAKDVLQRLTPWKLQW